MSIFQLIGWRQPNWKIQTSAVSLEALLSDSAVDICEIRCAILFSLIIIIISTGGKHSMIMPWESH